MAAGSETTEEAETTDDVETTREYGGECSVADRSAVPVFIDKEVREGLRETRDLEPRTPPRNLAFSYEHYGASPGFLDGSELLMLPHELALREQMTGIRTTSTTEREEKQISRRTRKYRGWIDRFSPE